MQFQGPAMRRNRRQVTAVPTESFLLFRVGDETYGASLQRVQEVVEPSTCTALPADRFPVCAALIHRGQRLPVIRMRALFDVTPDQPPGTARVLLLRGGERIVGLLVDEVLGVADVDPGRIEPLPGMATLLDPALFRGVAVRQDRLVLLLSEGGLAGLDEVGAFYAGGA